MTDICLLSRSVLGVVGLSLLTAACGKETKQAQPPSAAAAIAPATVDSESNDQSVTTACRSSSNAACFLDTAEVHAEGNGGDPVAVTHWILFGSAGDSVSIVAQVNMHATELGLAYIATNIGQEHEAAGYVSPRFRRRLTTNGVIDVSVSFGDVVANEKVAGTVAYTLRIQHDDFPLSAAYQPTDRFAKLDIVSAHPTDTFSMIPISIAPLVADRTGWVVHAQTYRVALVTDSLYELCRLPCVKPDTVKLKASDSVAKRY
jgi:hypothetical protein